MKLDDTYESSLVRLAEFLYQFAVSIGLWDWYHIFLRDFPEISERTPISTIPVVQCGLPTPPAIFPTAPHTVPRMLSLLIRDGNLTGQSVYYLPFITTRLKAIFKVSVNLVRL